MKEPVWISKSTAVAAHDEQIAEHGGRGGLINEGALEAALHRPRNLLHYGKPDLAELAASYGYGLAKDHAFSDGNKRVSAVVTELFLELNGYALELTDAELVTLWLGLAGGDIPEQALADVLRGAMRPMDPS
ncbi:type II toxin-antitoxin system death-on-curing family toxin [Hansschlegelia beijingensis]|uniref:Death-on-curing protein n=1 Tax=Hansschlegelia beijingensis TaxID=1133344 RepID=A0A7W6D184_9HYPH|nr:death-on-curing protein [Hansschlegelia beijingensis]